VQKQLGHATASITLDTYGHLFPDELDALADRLEDLHDRALEARRAADMWPTVAQPSSSSRKLQVDDLETGVPEEGLEPSCPLGPYAFKARLSASSSTPALTCQGRAPG